MLDLPISHMASLSTPTPSPAVGGIPCSSASTNYASLAIASPSSDLSYCWALKLLYCWTGSFSQEQPLAISLPSMNSSKRQERWLSSGFAKGERTRGWWIRKVGCFKCGYTRQPQSLSSNLGRVLICGTFRPCYQKIDSMYSCALSLPKKSIFLPIRSQIAPIYSTLQKFTGTATPNLPARVLTRSYVKPIMRWQSQYAAQTQTMVNQGLWVRSMPSLRKHLPSQNTFQQPPTINVFRYSQGEMRRNMSRPIQSSLVANGLAVAPPAARSSKGVSTSRKPDSTSSLLSSPVIWERRVKSAMASWLTIRSRQRCLCLVYQQSKVLGQGSIFRQGAKMRCAVQYRDSSPVLVRPGLPLTCRISPRLKVRACSTASCQLRISCTLLPPDTISIKTSFLP